MGVTVELEDADLRCRSQVATEAAAAIVATDHWASPYHLQVRPTCYASPPTDADWVLEIEHFQGDHWHNDDAERLWIALAPHMADGATLELRGEDSTRWRIRWQDGECDACHGEGEVAPGTEGAPYLRCPDCHGSGRIPRVFEDYVTEVRWAVERELTAPAGKDHVP